MNPIVHQFITREIVYPFPDAALHFGGWHDIDIVVTGRLFLCEGCLGNRCLQHRLAATDQFDDFRAELLTWLWTGAMADDGRNLTSENPWLGRISCNRFQLVLHIHRDKVIRFVIGYVYDHTLSQFEPNID